MAIRFSKDYNQNLRREVSNFNRRRDTAIRAGFKSVPDRAYVSELKRRYDKRGDLDRELKRLNEFNRDSLKEVEMSGGVKAVKWNIDYIKNNLEQAKKYYKREEAILADRVGRFPSQRDDLDIVIRNREILDRNIKEISQDEFDDMKGAIDTFIRSRNKWGAGYRGFMAEVDDVMTKVNIKKEDRDAFFAKFDKLSHEEFFYIYEDNDLIKRIYALIDSPKHKNKLTTGVKDAKKYINDLMAQADKLVEEAKNYNKQNKKA